jgi:hypothetical protein
MGTAMNILTATKDYEDWVSRHTHVIKSQLSDKHKQMAESPIPFLRGTFYRWTQLFPEICSELRKAPEVLAVGDLHIASFGTWRDGFGRLIWGIDDFDEAYTLPYVNDLVRLAVSAILDAAEGEIKVGLGNVVDVILDGYRTCLSGGGKPFVLEEKHKWLRHIALDSLDIPADFWKKIDALPASRTSVPADARNAIARLLPAPQLPCRVVRRIAGVGSLGHLAMWPSSSGAAAKSAWRQKPQYRPPVSGHGPQHRREFTTSSQWNRPSAAPILSCACAASGSSASSRLIPRPSTLRR